MDLPRRVWAFIRENDLLRPGQTVVLGVSGGPDSVCLLDLLHARAGEADLKIHVAHLDHGLRPEAAAEAEFVRAEAARRGLPFHTETVDTRGQAARDKTSIEEAARDLRYAFLTRVAQSAQAHAIAAAHNADDQAETVLMHFLRGSGMAGLRGMLAKSAVPSPKSEVESRFSDFRLRTSDRNLFLVRPLLSTSRADIEAYCAERGLRPRRDATNLDTTYFRNRLRHILLPELEKYNPNIREVLRRTAEIIAGEHARLAASLAALWAQNARLERERVTFDRPRWLALTSPEQRALLREAVQRLLPGRRDVDFTPLDHAVQFSRSAAPGRDCDVLGGLRFAVSYTTLVLAPWGAVPPAVDLPRVDEQGQLAAGWKFIVQTREPNAWSLAQVEAESSGWNVFVDAARLPWPGATGQSGLELRPRRPGDRFQPLGLDGHTVKVADFMINEKIEARLRDHWPLVACGDEIVWVAGLRLDERFKVTAEAQTVRQLSFVKEDATGE